MRWFSASPGRTASQRAAVAVPGGVPDALPVLSPGRHRTPRTGACFMEWASLLAGERFSDHPSCTHPLLAHLARMVNDATSDAGRSRLAPLVPSVVGLASEDPRWAYDVAVAAALVALPVAPEEESRALAAGILTCERLRAHHDDDAATPPARTDRGGHDTPPTSPGAALESVRSGTRAALEARPGATAWAVGFTDGLVSLHSLHDPAAALTEHAVVTVVRLGREDGDALLARMLRDAITAVAGRRPSEAPSAVTGTRSLTPAAAP